MALILIPTPDIGEVAKSFGWLLFILYLAYDEYKKRRAVKDPKPSTLQDAESAINLQAGQITRLTREKAEAIARAEDAEEKANLIGQAFLKLEGLDERIKALESEDNADIDRSKSPHRRRQR